MERHLGATYVDICQRDIMTKTTKTFPGPYMPTIKLDTGVKCYKTDVEMTSPKKKHQRGHPSENEE